MSDTNMSDLFQLLSDKMGADPSTLNSMFEAMKMNTSSNNTDSSHNDSTPDMPDIETIMKVKKIMDSMKETSNDPSINLLSSLKPYVKEEKKSKIDQYIKVLNMSKAISAFTDLGGDTK